MARTRPADVIGHEVGRYDPAMFNVGGGEIFVVLLLALLLLGPEKLPEAARRLGSLLAQVRRVTTGFQEEMRSAMDLGPSGEPDLLDSATAGPSLTGPTVETTPPAARPRSVGGAFVADLSETPSEGHRSPGG